MALSGNVRLLQQPPYSWRYPLLCHTFVHNIVNVSRHTCILASMPGINLPGDQILHIYCIWVLYTVSIYNDVAVLGNRCPLYVVKATSIFLISSITFWCVSSYSSRRYFVTVLADGMLYVGVSLWTRFLKPRPFTIMVVGRKSVAHILAMVLLYSSMVA